MDKSEIESRINGWKTILANTKAECKTYFNGTNYPTAVMGVMAEYGVENVFLVCEEYHGKYEDDYAYFTYLNNVTGEIFRDSWTTAAACPSYSLYKPLTVYDAVTMGYGINPALTEYCRRSIMDGCADLVAKYRNVMDSDTQPQIGRRVAINGGRKFRGEGYLVEVRVDENKYRPGSSTRVAAVYEEATNTVHEVNANYTEYADCEEFNKGYFEWVESDLRSLPLNEILPNDGSGRYSFVGKHHPATYYKEFYSKEHPFTLPQNASWPAKEERTAKNATDEAKLRRDLEVWASKFVDKTPEERAWMVERALAKRLNK